MNGLPLAVCALVRNGDKVLSITRGLEGPAAEDWNFPGGKVEGGESLEAACLRELYEETKFKGRVIRKVFEDTCEGPRDFYTTTFEVEVVTPGETGAVSHEGIVAWKTPEELTASTSSFRAYNIDCFRAVGLLPVDTFLYELYERAHSAYTRALKPVEARAKEIAARVARKEKLAYSDAYVRVLGGDAAVEIELVDHSAWRYSRHAVHEIRFPGEWLFLPEADVEMRIFCGGYERESHD